MNAHPSEILWRQVLRDSCFKYSVKISMSIISIHVNKFLSMKRGLTGRVYWICVDSSHWYDTWGNSHEDTGWDGAVKTLCNSLHTTQCYHRHDIIKSWPICQHRLLCRGKHCHAYLLLRVYGRIQAYTLHCITVLVLISAIVYPRYLCASTWFLNDV